MSEGAFVETLDSTCKKWFAYAVAGMVVADGQVTEDELVHLKETIRFLDSMEDVNEVVGMIKRKEKINLEVLKADRHTATKIFLEIATIAISDGSLSSTEVNFFRYVGSKLGFEGVFCDKVLKWGTELIQHKKEKKKLLKEGTELDAVYKTF